MKEFSQYYFIRTFSCSDIKEKQRDPGLSGERTIKGKSVRKRHRRHSFSCSWYYTNKSYQGSEALRGQPSYTENSARPRMPVPSSEKKPEDGEHLGRLRGHRGKAVNHNKYSNWMCNENNRPTAECTCLLNISQQKSGGTIHLQLSRLLNQKPPFPVIPLPRQRLEKDYSRVLSYSCVLPAN